MIARKFLPACTLVIGLWLVPLLACELSASTARIADVVLARDVQGENFEPVGATDTYAADQPAFHAVVSVENAPRDTLLKAVWTALDVGGAAQPNTTLDEAELSVEGSRNVDFTLTPGSGGWPPGTYQVDIYLDGALARTLTFRVAEVAQEAAPEPTPTPAAAREIVARAVMAVDVTPLTAAPVGITQIFPPGQSIVHAVVTLLDAPADTRVKAIWSALDVGEMASADRVLAEYEVVAEGSPNLDFTFQAEGEGFPPGRYRVEILVNGRPERVLDFRVAGEGEALPANPTPAPAPVGSCPPLPPRDPQPAGLVTGITMARGTAGPDYDPVDPVTVFSPEATFHAVVATQSVPENTEFRVAWFAQDVGSVEPCNTPIAAPFALTTSGTRNLDFSLAPPPGLRWPAGTYRVEVYANGRLEAEKVFHVE